MRPGKPERMGEGKQWYFRGNEIYGRGLIQGKSRPHMLFVKKIRGQRCRRKISSSWSWRHIRIDAGDPPAAFFQQRADAFVEAVHIDGICKEDIASGKVEGISGDHGGISLSKNVMASSPFPPERECRRMPVPRRRPAHDRKPFCPCPATGYGGMALFPVPCGTGIRVAG